MLILADILVNGFNEKLSLLTFGLAHLSIIIQINQISIEGIRKKYCELVSGIQTFVSKKNVDFGLTTNAK